MSRPYPYIMKGMRGGVLTGSITFVEELEVPADEPPFRVRLPRSSPASDGMAEQREAVIQLALRVAAKQQCPIWAIFAREDAVKAGPDGTLEHSTRMGG